MAIAPSPVFLRSCLRPVALAWIPALVLCLIPAPSAAQTGGGSAPFGMASPSRQERPYRGLFGGGVGSTEQMLTLEASVGAGIVTNPFAAQTLPAAEGGKSRSGGGSGSGAVRLTYSLSGDRIGINASNVFNTDYSPQAPHTSLVAREIATFGAYFVPAKSTRVNIEQTYKDLPDFSLLELLEPDFGQVIPPDRDLPVTVERYRRYGATLDINQRLSSRTQVNLTSGYGRGMVGSRDWTSLSWGATASQTITKQIGLYVTYAYGQQRSTNVVDGPGAKDHRSTISGGINFQKALSLTRRTKLSLSTGTAGNYHRVLKYTTYHLVGGVGVTREFGQTGTAAISYGRNLQYVETLSEPLLLDSFSAGVEGSFSRRVLFKTSVRASLGQLGSSGGTGVNHYAGSVQISFALTRYLALGTSYGYFRYSFADITSPLATVESRDRQRVAVSLQLWAPLMKRTKGSS